jgi:hypothetical protein
LVHRGRRWTVELTRQKTGQPLRFTTDFLWKGLGRFQGAIVHPPQWPEDLNYAGKRRPPLSDLFQRGAEVRCDRQVVREAHRLDGAPERAGRDDDAQLDPAGP